MRKSIGLLLLVLAVPLASCLAQTNAAQDAPPKMTHLIVQFSGDDVPADSFAAKPKTIWRASNKYCRVDELPDPEHGIHGSMIINEPDVWLVNHMDNSARHIVDQGPTFNCRLPMFANDPETLKTKIGELEFGNEIRFFIENGAELVDGPKLSFEAKYYSLKIGATTLILVERVDAHAPIRVAKISDGKAATFTYKLWEQSPIDLTLFSKPQGISIHEN